MPLWARRVLGVLALGGGATGVTIVLQQLLQSSNPIEWLFYAVFIGMYAFGVWCGILMLEGRENALRKNAVYWLLQIPVFSTYVFGYMFIGGFHLTAWYEWVGSGFGMDFLIGSTVSFNVMKTPDHSFIGVNLFALAITFWLNRLAVHEPSSSAASSAEFSVRAE